MLNGAINLSFFFLFFWGWWWSWGNAGLFLVLGQAACPPHSAGCDGDSPTAALLRHLPQLPTGGKWMNCAGLQKEDLFMVVSHMSRTETLDDIAVGFV